MREPVAGEAIGAALAAGVDKPKVTNIRDVLGNYAASSGNALANAQIDRAAMFAFNQPIHYAGASYTSASEIKA